MQMMLVVALGGALGSVARYLFVKVASDWVGTAFPFGTLGVNVLGCFSAGALSVLLVERLALAPEWRGLLMVGFLGGFTTFSAFSLETVHLLEEAGAVQALANVLLSMMLCLLACWAGLWITRQWL